MIFFIGFEVSDLSYRFPKPFSKTPDTCRIYAEPNVGLNDAWQPKCADPATLTSWHILIVSTVPTPIPAETLVQVAIYT